MPIETIYALEAVNVTVSDNGQLSGVSQGDGSHLDEKSIILNSNDWVPVLIDDNDPGFDDNDGSQRLEGDQDFNGVPYSDGTRVEAEFQIIVSDPSGVFYTLLALNFNEPGGGKSYATVEGLVFVDTGNGFPPINTVLKVESTSEGPSEPYVELVDPPCFTPGSRVSTPNGLRDVADIVAGDPVFTVDNGVQTVVWVGQVRLPMAVLGQTPRYRPILIRKDALGPGRPFCDMRVSPQHRILVSGWQAELLFGEVEVLVPAIKLCNGTTIYQDDEIADVTYIHVMFEQHEVICVDGIPTESYLPAAEDDTPMAQELAGLFPEMSTSSAAIVTARPCVSDRRAKAYAA